MPWTILLVDDEPLAREGLRILVEHDTDFGTILEARNGIEAVQTIRTSRPDLVFLDVQMPEMDGLAVVREIGAERMPAVVFVTAFDQYAVQAFEINAIDYLLKPVTEDRFSRALDRAKQRLRTDDSGEKTRRIMTMLEAMSESPARYVKRLAIRSSGKTTFVNVEDIDWIEAAENYVELHVDRGSQLLHVTMNTLARSLDPEVFLRVHRSIIVNVKRIQELRPAAHGEFTVTLSNGVRLQTGRSYHDKLKAWAANPF